MESLKLDKDKLKDFIAALDSKVYAPQKWVKLSSLHQLIDQR